MKTRDLDRLARGPNPHERVRPPHPGERCPRCHGGGGDMLRPCLLHNPALVPIEFGGGKA